MNAWLMLALAIAAEVAATVALKFAAGLTRPLPTVVVVVGYGAALWLLSRIVLTLPVGTTYAVWAGAGTAATALVGSVFLGESFGWLKAASLVLIIVGVVGLNLVDDAPDRPGGTTAAGTAAPATSVSHREPEER